MNLNRLRAQDGIVLPVAMMVLGVTLMVCLAIITLGDTQNKRSGEQRVRESALNLAEGVLYGQGFVLANNWPVTITGKYPATCTDAATPASAPLCANRDTLAAANSTTASSAVFNSTDFQASTGWTTRVRDDYGALQDDYFTSAADGALTGSLGACPVTPCSFDFNGNKKIWVEASSTVRDIPRTIVAKLQLEQFSESIPQSAITAGAFATTNMGNNVLVNDAGSGVFVRCTNINYNNPSNNNCAGWDPGQIVPTLPTTLASATASKPMMDPAQIERFKQRAIADNKYFTGCPPQNADLRGSVVFVEGCKDEPTFANQLVTNPCYPAEHAPSGMSDTCINTIDKPGILLWHCGRSDFQGGMTYVGVIYMINNSNGGCPSTIGTNGTLGGSNPRCVGRSEKDQLDAFFSSGGFGIWGALNVDGNACAKVGSNGLQFTYDARVFATVQSYGTVGLIQNTWRELKARQALN